VSSISLTSSFFLFVVVTASHRSTLVYIPLRYAYLAYATHRTLIDSTPGVLKAWEIFAKDYSLGDSAAIAHATHGRRLYDTLKEYCHIEDEVKLQVCVPSLFHS
jgi:hypothetical protein